MSDFHYSIIFNLFHNSKLLEIFKIRKPFIFEQLTNLSEKNLYYHIF